jgi:hypothetical protein
MDRAIPDFAEFIIGPAEGRTRWLNPGYRLPEGRRGSQPNAPRCRTSTCRTKLRDIVEKIGYQGLDLAHLHV